MEGKPRGQPSFTSDDDDRVRSEITFLRQLLVVDQLPVSQVVEDGAKVGGVPVNHIGPGLVLRKERSSTSAV